ncbi:hypothetical protein HYPSUDRAFT_87636 [Hypholoma sublateritium FD-334 SS-4]|uniref:Uncharacterized protein n=1 Tax=Hypholoma sublateritium (strain FD-334 SS-4) TaxID=945553 RepID=A0A0D2PPX6_HYPSF|nr:hypothetical protein HYPSUDRAFT_41385 [Hypholoma sublateritium FD-334 SS-4]KJA22005.1 hypothetical protein HYPSUDRAFT_87636 [Hypholoma sublateritium FD-334 SS-4]
MFSAGDILNVESYLDCDGCSSVVDQAKVQQTEGKSGEIAKWPDESQCEATASARPGDAQEGGEDLCACQRRTAMPHSGPQSLVTAAMQQAHPVKPLSATSKSKIHFEFHTPAVVLSALFSLLRCTAAFPHRTRSLRPYVGARGKLTSQPRKGMQIYVGQRPPRHKVVTFVGLCLSRRYETYSP